MLICGLPSCETRGAALGAPMLILYFLTLPCVAFAVPSFVPVPGLGWVRAPGAGVAPAQGFVSPAAVH